MSAQRVLLRGMHAALHALRSLIIRCMHQVWDNGEGMGAEGLRQWAVMNLSMGDRGQQPVQAPETAAEGAGGFLDAQLSFFGVRRSRNFPNKRLCAAIASSAC